jgi:hypothetical protein
MTVSPSIRERLSKTEINMSAILVDAWDMADLYAWYVRSDGDYYSRKTPWRLYLMLAAARETTVGEHVKCGECGGCGRVADQRRGSRDCPRCYAIGTIIIDVSEVHARYHTYSPGPMSLQSELLSELGPDREDSIAAVPRAGYLLYLNGADERAPDNGEPANGYECYAWSAYAREASQGEAS